jgi:hypothetical protein
VIPTGEDAVLAEHHVKAHLRRGETGERDFACRDHGRRRVDSRGTQLHQRSALGRRAVPDDDLVPLLNQAAGHAVAHDANADETVLDHVQKVCCVSARHKKDEK